MKLLFWVLLVALLGLGLWVGFALWTGIYSVYSIPPSADEPEGVTMLVGREDGEPMFNSPQAPPPRKRAAKKSGSISFGSSPGAKRPLEQRTIVRLPYLEWAYKKSLEPPDSTP
jgi:hypothetical protein